MLWTLTQVAIGGALGSVLRYLATLAVSAPLGTLMVNVAGSLLIGVLYVTLKQSPLLMTGVLGGFTTFSAFSLDAMKLTQSGHTTQALAYIAGTVLLSLAAVALGAALTQRLA